MSLVIQKQIQEGMIKYAASVLDGVLSEMPTELGSTPSVIKDRQTTRGKKAPRPDFPYVVVDRKATLRGAPQDNAWLRHQYINDEGLIVYVSEQRVGLTLSCYGEDADTILTQLQISVLDDLYRNDLNVLAGAKFQQFSSITDNSIFLETDFVDGALMDVYFTAISTWTPRGRGSSVIETIKVDGEYKETVSNLTTEIVVDSSNS